MSVHWTFSLAAGMAVLLGGALLATAAAPSTAQNSPAMQGPAAIIQISTLKGMTVLDSQGNKLGQIRDVALDSQTGRATFVVLDAAAPGSGQPVPYTAARPIDNPSMPAPSAVATPVSPPCVMPQSCVNSGDPGWTQDLEDFYNE